MFLLPAARTYEEGLPTKAEIPGFWGTSVPIVSETCGGAVCSFLPQHGLEEPLSVLGSCMGVSRYTGRPEGPDYGPRQRTGPTCRDVRGSGVCLRHHTTD